MTEECEFEVPSWERIHTMLLHLAKRIRKSGFEPDVIVGVCRGGWLPARVLSDLLGNSQIASVKAEFYLGVAERKNKPRITQHVSVPVRDKKVLVADDVTDSGQSLGLVKSHMRKLGATDVRVVTLFYKPWSKIIPDYYEKKTNKWIVFPWEIRETVCNLIETFQEQGKTIHEAKRKLIKSGLNSKLVEYFTEEFCEGKE
jgi:hypoxanthine phosphoribosyltransferase